MEKMNSFAIVNQALEDGSAVVAGNIGISEGIAQLALTALNNNGVEDTIFVVLSNRSSLHRASEHLSEMVGPVRSRMSSTFIYGRAEEPFFDTSPQKRIVFTTAEYFVTSGAVFSAKFLILDESTRADSYMVYLTALLHRRNSDETLPSATIVYVRHSGWYSGSKHVPRAGSVAMTQLSENGTYPEMVLFSSDDPLPEASAIVQKGMSPVSAVRDMIAAGHKGIVVFAGRFSEAKEIWSDISNHYSSSKVEAAIFFENSLPQTRADFLTPPQEDRTKVLIVRGLCDVEDVIPWATAGVTLGMDFQDYTGYDLSTRLSPFCLSPVDLARQKSMVGGLAENEDFVMCLPKQPSNLRPWSHRYWDLYALEDLFLFSVASGFPIDSLDYSEDLQFPKERVAKTIERITKTYPLVERDATTGEWVVTDMGRSISEFPCSWNAGLAYYHAFNADTTEDKRYLRAAIPLIAVLDFNKTTNSDQLRSAGNYLGCADYLKSTPVLETVLFRAIKHLGVSPRDLNVSHLTVREIQNSLDKIVAFDDQEPIWDFYDDVFRNNRADPCDDTLTFLKAIIFQASIHRLAMTSFDRPREYKVYSRNNSSNYGYTLNSREECFVSDSNPQVFHKRTLDVPSSGRIYRATDTRSLVGHTIAFLESTTYYMPQDACRVEELFPGSFYAHFPHPIEKDTAFSLAMERFKR